MNAGKAALWGAGVVAGNGALMALLGSAPFADPAARWAASAGAMALHGWGAWALGCCVWAWAKGSRELARAAAREAVGEVERALEREARKPS